VIGLRACFKFSNSLQGFFSQSAPITSDVDLSNALDVWHATVERGDELVQMPELARSIRFSTALAPGHRNPPERPATTFGNSSVSASDAFMISG
jgi:hypothetical protein